MKTAIIPLIVIMTLCACGGGGGDVTTPSPTNIQPVADAGASRVVQPGSEVLLDGSASSDTDGQIISYQWKQITGAVVNLIDKDTVSARFVAPETDNREELGFELTVQDNAGASDIDDVPITVNIKPVVNAGPDQELNLSSPNTGAITLTGTSNDGDGTIISHLWVQTGGPAVTQLADASTSTATVTVPAATQDYAFSYTVTDDDGAQQTDTVSVYTTEIILSDSFADDSDWSYVNNTGYSADWSVVNGQLQQSNFLANRSAYEGLTSYHTGTYAILANPAMNGASAYRFSVDVTPLTNIGSVLSQGNDVGIMFLRQNDDNYYRVSMNAKHGFTRFEKVLNGTFQTLAVNAIGYVENQPMTMTAEVNGNAIIIWIDGDPIFAVVDSSMPASGTIALYCQDRAKFDNVQITEPPLQPLVALSSPLAYSVALTPGDGNTLSAQAVVLNQPVDGEVVFTIDDGIETVATASGKIYSAQFSDVTNGEHEVTAIIREADGTEVSADVNATVGTGGDYYVTIGDSITTGMGDEKPWNNDSTDGRIVSIQGYQARLADALTTTTGRPQIIFNEGVEGDTASDLNNRISSILERYPGANKVLMMIGTNDSGGSSVNPGTFENTIRAIANRIDDVNGKQVWIAKPPPTYVIGTSTLDASRNSVIVDYNQRILTVTGEDPGDDTFLGPNFHTQINNFNLYADYLHLNDAGYQVMANEWIKKLP